MSFYMCRTPHEINAHVAMACLRYLRDLHNDFHGGLAVTYHDTVTGVEEVEKVLHSVG